MDEGTKRKIFEGFELDKLKDFCKNCAKEDKRIHEQRKNNPGQNIEPFPEPKKKKPEPKPEPVKLPISQEPSEIINKEEKKSNKKEEDKDKEEIKKNVIG